MSRLIDGSKAKRAVAFCVMAITYAFVEPAAMPSADREQIAQRFHFAVEPLPDPVSTPHRAIRAVHPSLSRIAAWISAVGAGVALTDLDGDGLPNDICHVDPRTDSIIVSQAASKEIRSYSPFTLDFERATFDPASIAPMGCLPGDVNEDGRMDLLVYFWGRTPLAFINKGGPLSRAAFEVRDIVPGQERWYTNAATFADIDGDGHVDLVIGNYFPDGSAILDAKGAGLESMQHSMSRAANGGSHRLLRGDGSGTFTDISSCLDASLQHGWTLAVGAADLDGDQLPEIYFAHDFNSDLLLHNRSTRQRVQLAPVLGRRGFFTPGSKVLGRDSFKGMGIDFGDVNEDGIPDIAVSNIAAPYALEESHLLFVSSGDVGQLRRGRAPYDDRSERFGVSRSGWAWDAKFADFDNDGVLELLQATGFIAGGVNRWPELQELAMGNDDLLSHPRSWPRFLRGDALNSRDRHPFFVRAANGRYYDVASEIGMEQSEVARGIAIADVDRDGLLDYAIANQWDVSYLNHNVSRRHGAFLGLQLRIPVRSDAPVTISAGLPPADVPSSPAIGASVTVHLEDGRVLVGQVDGGNGHSGKRSPDLHFGLGRMSASSKVRVEIRWRSRDASTHRLEEWFSPGWHTVQLGRVISE